MRLPSSPNTRSAFSLIELLAVISIIALLAGLSFPTMRNLLQNTAVNTAEGQVNNAISAARVYATRYKPFVTARPVGGTLRTSQDHGDGYSGALVLFCNDNTLRIYENDENAYDPSEPVKWLELMVPPRNGYAPVPEIEDLRFTGRVVALGLVRTGPGPYDVQLIPPPFALLFNRDGTLGQGQDDNNVLTAGVNDQWDRFIYVSPTGDTLSLGTGKNRIEATEYDINEDRGSLSNYNSARFGLEGTARMDDGRVELPFGAIETVVGVVLVEPDEVPNEFEHPGTNNKITLNFNRDRIESIYNEDQSAALLAWALENGTYARIMLFNRYTGQDLTR